MSEKHLVSVIIPSYNHEKYITEAVLSVIHQTYPHIEIILIDDGSKDKTADIAEQILRENKRPYQLIRQENQGSHQAINIGLSLAHGDFLTILNSDDYYHLDRISILLNALLEKNVNFVFTRVNHVNQDNADMPMTSPAVKDYHTALKDKETFPTPNFQLLRYNFAVTTGNYFFTRTLFERVGDFKNFKFCNDWDFILRILIHEEPFYIDTPLINYRLHASNTIAAASKNGIPGKEAERETESVLLNYFKATGTAQNELAPCSKYWGNYWPYFAEKYLLPIISLDSLKPYFA